MSEHRKVNIDLAFIESEVRWNDQKAIMKLFDGFKDSRATQPVYVMALNPHMLAYIIEECSKCLKSMRSNIQKEIDSSADFLSE